MLQSLCKSVNLSLLCSRQRTKIFLALLLTAYSGFLSIAPQPDYPSRDTNMGMKLTVVCTAIILLVSACNHLPSSKTEVSRQHLLHSMFYTHRNLANIAINPQPALERKKLLIHSHCDLIDRQLVEGDASHCDTRTTQTNTCIASFHSCIGHCPNFKHDCLPCEQKALSCLSKNAK